MNDKSVRKLTEGAVIAAVYALLTILLPATTAGTVEFRISEAVTLLAALTPAAIPGLTVGCLLANASGCPDDLFYTEKPPDCRCLAGSIQRADYRSSSEICVSSGRPAVYTDAFRSGRGGCHLLSARHTAGKRTAEDEYSRTQIIRKTSNGG